MIGRVRIRSGETTSVEINGEDISASLVGLRLDMGVDQLPVVHLDIVGADPEVDLEVAEAIVNDRCREVLDKLGWTPPAD